MRGYFGIGIEGASKAMNVGSLFRSAHAFGASFVFTVAAAYDEGEGALADTSDAPSNVPFYAFPDVGSLVLPADCTLVGVELLDQATELPSFRHPRRAAYVLGPERGALSPALAKRCEFLVKIPAAFCVNVGVAGALVMYDRLISLGRFPRRPIMPGGPVEPLPEHVFGEPILRKKIETYRKTPPKATPT
jgi:tRNA G18 (ribose-2'-O)-methylase SpoU